MTGLASILFFTIAAVWLYALVGYPVLMWIVGQTAKHRDPIDNAMPSVTLIVPAHNEERVLREKLKNCQEIAYPETQLEILVASDGSQDGTVEIAQEFSNETIRLLDFKERRGKASVVNDAVAQATGEIVCLCDANVMFAPDALQILVNGLQDPKVGAATGQVVLRSEESNFEHGETTYYSIERTVQVGESRVGSLIGVDGGMYVIRRELYHPLPPDTILDDFVISMRVIQQGFRVIYVPEAVAHESGTPLAIQEFRRRVRVAAGSVQVLKRGDYPPLRRPIEFWQFCSHKILRWLGPMFMVVLLALNVYLLNRGIVFQVIGSGQLVVYLLAIFATFSLKLRNTPLGGVPFYFVMSHVAMAIGYVKGIMNTQKVTWAQAARPESGSQHADPAN